jgi:hypothetical protein
MKIINEGLDYHDLKGQIKPIISIDEYAAKMGSDSDIVTLTFTVNSKLAAEDLVSWLEIGYDYVLDASVSEGELEPGKWLVFVEMKRRSNIPKKIIDILSELETLTDLLVTDYTVRLNEEEYDADENILQQIMILSPSEYKKEKESEQELNEMRNIAGLKSKKIYTDIDKEIRHIIDIAKI